MARHRVLAAPEKCAKEAWHDGCGYRAACVLAMLLATGTSTRADAAGSAPQAVPGGASALAVGPLTVGGTLHNVKGEPLPGILTSLFRWNGSDWAHDYLTMRTTTAADGSYAFVVPPGLYLVGFGVHGANSSGGILYRAEYFSGALDRTTATSVEVTSAPAASVDATMHAYPTIEGYVVARPTGEGISHVTFEVSSYDEDAGSWVEYRTGTSSSSNGYYRIGMPPGRYRVRYVRTPDYDSIYYPDATDFADAEDFVLEWDEARSLGNTGLWRRTSIRGVPRSSGPSGYNPPDARLMLYKKQGPDWALEAMSELPPRAPEAGFKLAGSFEGTYRIVVEGNSPNYRDLGYPSGVDLETAEDIVVSRGLVYDLEFPLEPVWGSIAGTVTVSPDGTPAGGREVSLRLVRAVSPSTWPPPTVDTTVTAADGTYCFPRVEPSPDRFSGYAFRVVDPTGYCAPKSEGVGSNSVIDPAAVVPGTRTTRDITTYVAGRYVGTVLEQGTGKPQPGMTVSFRNWWSDTTYTTTTRFDGKFDSGPVAPCNDEQKLPGTYYVVSVTDPAGVSQLITPSDVFSNPITEGQTRELLLEMVKVAKDTAATFSTYSKTCGWGSQTTLSGSLKTAQGEAVGGASLTSEYSYDGKTWKPLGTPSTGPDGSFSLTAKPVRITYYRVKYAGSPFAYVGCVSRTVKVTPYAYLSSPSVPSHAHKNRTFKVTGSLKPRHSGSRVVRLYCYRSERGKWVLRKSLWCSLTSTTTGSRYTASVKLPYRGTWRMRAYIAGDSVHASTWSPARSLRVY